MQTSVRSSSSLGRTARARKLKKRGCAAARRRSSLLVIPSLHISVTCAMQEPLFLAIAWFHYPSLKKLMLAERATRAGVRFRGIYHSEDVRYVS